MATFWATFGNVDNRARTGGTLPVMKGRHAVGLEPLSVSGTSQVIQFNSADWVASLAGTVTLQADGAVWVAIAATPVAVKGVAGVTDGVTFYIGTNERLDLTVEVNDKIAVIAA